MEDQEAVTRAELSTPAKSDVFNRLYAGRKVDVKTKSQTAGAESEKVTTKAKGRPVLSRFSGSKVDGQRQVGGRRISFKTPGTNASQRSKPKPASANQPDRVPPSVKFAKNKLQSAKYWLSIVDVAEKAENHLVALGLFRLAISCSAEPTSEVRKAYAAYRARYKLEQLTEPSQEYLNVEAEEEQVEPDPSKVCNVEVQCPGAGSVEGFDELEAICDDGGLEPDEDVEKKKKLEGVKNLYEEEYSRIPAKEPEPSAGNHSVSEVINLDDVQDVTSPPRALERTATPMRVRSTPLRASAIRASQRIEESAKKQTRRKFPQHKTETATPAKATGLEVDKMDVNTLMKEVVGLLAGSCNEVQSPAKEPANAVADSPNKTNKTTADSKPAKPGKKPSKLSSKEQSGAVNESIVNGNNISEKENVLHCAATDEERKEASKAAPAPSPGEGTKRRLRPTPKKISKAPFH